MLLYMSIGMVPDMPWFCNEGIEIIRRNVGVSLAPCSVNKARSVKNMKQTTRASPHNSKTQNQPPLSSFVTKWISMDEAMKDFRPWNEIILDRDVKYQGYQRNKEGQPEGYIDFHVIAKIVEAVVDVKVKRNGRKTPKKVKRPGYKLVVTQNVALPEMERITHILYEESFTENLLKKAFDVFQGEVTYLQSCIEIAESRAKLIPNRRDIFECPFCGWVTDEWSDDITCEGCGKRFWSQRLWNRKVEANGGSYPN